MRKNEDGGKGGRGGGWGVGGGAEKNMKKRDRSVPAAVG